MKKLLTLLFCSAFCTQLFAQIPELSINNFKGSYLCENLSTTFHIPDSLQGKHKLSDVEVVKNTNDHAIQIHISLIITGDDTIKQVAIELNEYFTPNDYNIENYSSWSVSYTLSIDGADLLHLSGSANPFETCYEHTNSCEDITIYAKHIRPICPSDDLTFSVGKTVSEDSILFFPSFESTPREIICDGIGNTIVTDSTKIYKHYWSPNGTNQFNLKNQVYQLFKADSLDVVCIKEPCPAPVYTTKIGDVNFTECLPIEPLFGSGVFTGSSLCNNLSIKYEIPTAYQGQFNYDYLIHQNESKDSLIVEYFLSSNPNADVLEKIEIPITKYFNETPTYITTATIVIQKLNINNNYIGADTTHGSPYAQCYNLKAECEKVVIYRKSMRAVCPTSDIYTRTTSEIKNDIIIGDFIDSTVLRTMICLAFGFNLHTDSLVIDSDFEALNYRVYLGSNIECIDGACPAMDLAPQFLGKADLSECIINGVSNINSNKSFIYPNPAKQHISIKGLNGTLYLSNGLGQNYELKGAEQFSVSELPNGIYIATFEINGEIKREKIIIQ